MTEVSGMKKKKIYFVRLKSALLYSGIIAFIILIIVNSKQSIEAVKNALIICYQTIIPSLFPFFVLSGLLINTGFIKIFGTLLSPVIRPIFRVSGSGAIVFIIGVISGYPMGAKMVTELCEKGIISKTEGKRLLPFCNNSGPLFVIAAVGTGMLNNVKAGIFLYCIHIISALLVGFLFRYYGKKEDILLNLDLKSNKNQASIGKVFSECVSNSVNSILVICGFIALFSSFSQSIKPIIDVYINNKYINMLLNGLLEVTMGVNKVSQSGISLAQEIILISFLVGFGGLCVHLQVIGIISGSGLGIKTYFIGKFMHASFSAVLAWIALKFIPFESVSVWNQYTKEQTTLSYSWSFILAAIIILVFILNMRKKSSKQT